jgi:hypothetical protein
LVTPDADLAEESASSFDGQKRALHDMSMFLRTKGVPVLPRVAFAMMRAALNMPKACLAAGSEA